MKIKQAIKVDRYKLEEEAASQAERFLKHADKIPPLSEEKATLDLDLKILRSKLARKIRTKPKKYLPKAIEKVTEGAITETVNLNKKVIALEKKIIKIKARLQKHDFRKQAFDQRRSMINRLVELHNDQYWSKDHLPDHEMVDAEFRRDMKAVKKKRGKIK